MEKTEIALGLSTLIHTDHPSPHSADYLRLYCKARRSSSEDRELFSLFETLSAFPFGGFGGSIKRPLWHFHDRLHEHVGVEATARHFELLRRLVPLGMTLSAAGVR
jgi:hypothetical protein